MLLAGEVQEIVIHSGLPLATIVLRPDAIFKGQRITNQRFRLKLSSQGDKATTGISDKNLEDKIRATEAKIGIPPGSGVSLLMYSLVPIRRTGSINRHSSFIQPYIFTKI